MSCTSVFGLITTGDCAPKTATVANSITKHVNKIMNETLVEQMSKDELSTQQIQRIIASSKIGDINISDVKLEQRSTISIESFKAAQTEQQVQDMMKQLAKNLSKDVIKAQTELGAPAISTTSLTNITNIMEKEITNKMSLEQFNECIGQVYQLQSLEANTEIGDVNIVGIDMQQTANATAKCVGSQIAKSLMDSSSLQDALNETFKDVESTGKGFGGLVGDFFSGLGDFVGGFANLAIIGGVIFVIILMLFLFFLFSGGSGGSSTPTPTMAPTMAPPATGYAYTPTQYGYGRVGRGFWDKYPAMSELFDIFKY
jgi:hypothetical protein